MKKNFFTENLIEWYHENKRDLPWRKTKDPYLIWLSEVLLQQTRVQQGLPFYHSFVEAFPTISLLAMAEEREVLRLWQGLGYYSRARNLHAAAKYIVQQFEGQLPDSYDGLIKLKGIGAYTAAAIASFAFQENVAVVDGNVYRVLARVFGIHSDIASGAGAKEFSLLANKLLPDKNVSTYNQAIMEFGALQCTPVAPRCTICPLAAICIANKKGIQHLLPVKSKKLKKKQRYFSYLAFKYKDVYLMHERHEGDIWTGLFEFKLIEKESLESIEFLLDQEELSFQELIILSESREYKHILTHQTIFAKFWTLEVDSKAKLNLLQKKYRLSAYTRDEIKALPKPVLIIKFLDEHVFS